MGSINTAETAEHGGRPPGKIAASLNDELNNVEWGEYKLGDLFEVKSYKKRFDANKVQLGDRGHPYIVRMSTNNGKKGLVEEDEVFLNEGNTLSFGQDTATIFYQEKPYFTGDKIKILKPKLKDFNKDNAQFFVAAITQAFQSFAWGTSSFSIETIEKQQVQLPYLNGKINFPFMEKFIAELEAQRIAELEAQRIAELEAYLSVTGLKDTHLSFGEEQALQEFRNIEWGEFDYKKIFNHIKQGRRLKKEDHITGNVPFVMSGTTNTGVVGYIANPVAIFPKNSITIDIFGNSFYRNYDFGAGDDTGVYWKTNTSYSKEAMLFMTSAMEKSMAGKYSYGKKLRSSQSLDFKMKLPVTNGCADFQTMETLISAIQKLVIKDVVLYADSKINATKTIVNQ